MTAEIESAGLDEIRGPPAKRRREEFHKGGRIANAATADARLGIDERFQLCAIPECHQRLAGGAL